MLRLRLLVCSLFLVATATAQYQTPPDELARLVDAPSAPQVSISPDNAMMAILDRQARPTIEDLAQPELRLGGLRINPRTFGPSRTTYTTGISFKEVAPGNAQRVTGLPDDVRISYANWSPDSRHLAFAVTRLDGIELWVADAESGSARRLITTDVNAVRGWPYRWAPDGESLYALLVPDGAGDAPAAPDVPTTPVVQQTDGQAAAARTYQDLLASPHDEDVFEHFATSQLARVGLNGMVTPLGDPNIYMGFTPSPDGRYLLVSTVHRPYSYLVPASRFPSYSDVIAATDGSLVFRLADQPAIENIPTGFGSTYLGVRSEAWRQDQPATLAWVEAIDGGDGKVEAEERDAMFHLAAPFDGDPARIATLKYRYAGAFWSDEGYFLVQERWVQNRARRMYRVDDNGDQTLVMDVSYEDRYADPGSPMFHEGEMGYVLATRGDAVYFTGAGASADGQRPFVQLRNLSDGSVEEVFRSRDPRYESPIGLVGDGHLLIRTEAVDDPPNYALVELGSGETTAVTDFPHPYPDLKDVHKELITYERKDGVKLSATLYLPPGYERDRDGPLPALVWAYPREFKSAAAASQTTGSPFRFTSVSASGAVPFVTRGYAVINNAAMPVIGEGDAQPNDSFVEQLVMNAEAAIDAGVSRGVVDRDRVAIAGHSYGAFMTANLLAHSDLFRAGIARSGAYNRSLTPFGFQAEPRTFWEAPETYFAMSPFMNADHVDEPILLIHGMADNNSGTFPVQSERFYHALKGLGGTARLVMLPHESHGYRARESVMHMLWETSNWLDNHVRDAVPRRVSVDGPVGND
ncbi:MAG: prolyl oligopeptidase family serine peptidase [Rhodothermales bacterium]|nr:prolyl oligopeptidase family serine peptidase [Rhodothermales bacterium]MBO6778697.1 prolyl oligopeptidase family serine peptidase [Rhodothermales bacterium]